jgi:long-chain acyl-CoA synthetase
MPTDSSEALSRPTVATVASGNEFDRRSTLLDRFLAWEALSSQAVYMTQPMPDGRVLDYTWAAVGENARRMASYLVGLQLPTKS